MENITDILKREILDFESEILQKFFKDNILENFEEIEKYLERRVNSVQNRVFETLVTEERKPYICMTVMNEEEYRLNDNIFSPVDINTFSKKINNNNKNMRNIIVNEDMVIDTIFMELSEDEENVIQDRVFDGFIEKDGDEIPIRIKLQKNEKYNKIIEDLYYLFQNNGMEWKTVNSYYNNNFYNVILETFEKSYLNLENVQNIEYDLE